MSQSDSFVSLQSYVDALDEPTDVVYIDHVLPDFYAAVVTESATDDTTKEILYIDRSVSSPTLNDWQQVTCTSASPEFFQTEQTGSFQFIEFSYQIEDELGLIIEGEVGGNSYYSRHSSTDGSPDYFYSSVLDQEGVSIREVNVDAAARNGNAVGNIEYFQFQNFFGKAFSFLGPRRKDCQLTM